MGCQMLPDKTEPSRIDAVECPETSLGIPPAFGSCSEAVDFPGIDGVVGPAQHFLSWSDQYIRLNEFNRRKKMMGLCRCFGNIGAALVAPCSGSLSAESLSSEVWVS